MSQSPHGIEAAAAAEVGIALSLLVAALEHCGDDARGDREIGEQNKG